MTNGVSGEVVNYSYDSLGRLSLAQTTGTQWGESFTYDGFGNLTSEVATKGTAFTSYQTFDPTTNRLTGGGTSYDANGNLLTMAGGLTMTYDEENRMVQAVNSSSVTEADVYNPSGQLVYRQQGSGTPEVYMYGPQGQRIRMTYPQNGQVYLVYQDQELYFAGKLLEADDNVGTTTVTSNGWANGTFPYGELRQALPYGTSSRYATSLLDTTTNLNYAMHRWYSSQVARFTTVDPSESANLGSPQSWNQYAYVMGDPVNSSDPEGLDVKPLDIEFGLTPTCLEEFTRYVSTGVNEWLNSDQGTMALQVYWENRGRGTSVDEMVWTSIANVFRNRWHLSNAEKKQYGFTTKGFKQLIYSTSGPKWNQSGTKQAAASIWAPDGKLKDQYRSELIDILDGSPDSTDCKGMIDAFRTSDQVYNEPPHDDSSDPTNGALWFYAAGVNNPIPTNPSKLNIPLLPTEIIPSSYSNGGANAWIFYRPLAGWSY